MYSDTLKELAETARKKAAMAKSFPLPFLVGAMMAGAYVGLGIILIFSLGASLEPGWQRLVMGASFGIALTLVVFAGSDLFTGCRLSMTVDWLHRSLTASGLARVWAISWLGNGLGALLLAGIFVAGGGGVLLGEHPDTVSLAGMAGNLAWVSLGNVVVGSVFMAAGYWVSSPSLWSREGAAEARAVLSKQGLPTA